MHNFKKYTLRLLIGVLIFCGMGFQSAQAVIPPPHTDPGNLGDWVLRTDMSDEFDGTALDHSKWQVCGKDGIYWAGSFTGRSYDASSYDTGWEFSPDNLRVTNGLLKITTEYDTSYPWVSNPYGNNEFTTGGMWSKQTFYIGYMEIRCKAANAKTTSSFWTTGSGAEIDVFEAVGDSTRSDRMWSSLHDWDYPTQPNRAWTQTSTLPFDFDDGFHTYAAEWDTHSVKFYADGLLIHAVDRATVEAGGYTPQESTNWPLTGGQHVWADSEIFPWWGTPSSGDLPADYEVEYIRVWQKGAPSLWSQFANTYGLSGVKTDHSDADTLNDWGEYVFDGNPTNPADVGILPELGATGDYTFDLRNDTGIVARVVTKTDLNDAVWSTNDIVSPTVHDGGMDTYVSPLGTSASNLFVKVLVDEGVPLGPVYQVVIGDGGGVGTASSGNGNFEGITASGNPIAMSLVPSWFAIGRAETQTFGTTDGMDSSPEPNSKGCYIFQSYTAGNDTGYTVQAAGETFSLSIAHNQYGNTGDYTGDEKVVLTIFTSSTGVDGNTVIGDLNILSATKFDIDSNTWPTDTADHVYTTTASDVGETVYLGLTLENPTTPNVFPRCDVVKMEVNK